MHPAARYLWWTVVLCCAHFGCSPADAGSEVCGLKCSGTVVCTNGASGTATVGADACLFQAPDGTKVTLTCYQKVTVVDPAGQTAYGTWSGSNTSVTLTIDGANETCTIDPGGSGAGVPGGAGAGGPSPCEQCVTSACGEEIQSCAANGCDALVGCIAACKGDQPCADACQGQLPQAVSPLTEFLRCVEASCTSECG